MWKTCERRIYESELIIEGDKKNEMVKKEKKKM